MSSPADLVRHPHGISTVDAMYVRPGFAAVHVIERDRRAAIVDTGANSSVPEVYRALERLGIAPAHVETVFLTHVHLDHAGGAGLLLQGLPNARVVVHPRGAQHLIDPSRLAAATEAVYGQQAFQRLYGSLVPIPAERIVQTRDLDELRVGSSTLSVLHTPGHALHHQVLFDPEGAAVFAGDTFGLSYRVFDNERGAFIVPTTTPTQFDPEQLSASVARIAGLNAQAAYLTHYGRVTGLVQLAADLQEQIREFVRIARRHEAATDAFSAIRAELQALWLERLHRHGIEPNERTHSWLNEDLDLNTRGLLAWLARAQKTAPRPGN